MKPAPSPQSLQILRAERRPVTAVAGVASRHCFSFGEHYDSRNTHFGILIVNNEDVIEAGAGYDEHEHADTEIVTWVMSGTLLHRDSESRAVEVPAGHAQHVGAGAGIVHSERNAADAELHLVQMWLPPHAKGLAPAYGLSDVRAALDTNEMFVVASGMKKHADGAALVIRQEHAALHAADINTEQSVVLPDAPFVHLFVTRGSVDLEGASLMFAGDSARIAGGGGQRVTAGPDGAEILVWEMYASF